MSPHPPHTTHTTPTTPHTPLTLHTPHTEGFGEDYIRPLTAYRLLQTERMACVDLTVLNDNLLEDTETLQARLIRVTDSVGNVITSDRLTLDPQIADITILDNDRKYSI